jgi:hypothetical protein
MMPGRAGPPVNSVSQAGAKTTTPGAKPDSSAVSTGLVVVET